MRPHTQAMICRAWIAGVLAMVACSSSSSTPRETAEPASSTPQVTTSSTVPTSSTPSSTTLIWSDEFNDGDQPSSQWWNFETGYGPDGWGWGNNEWQLYTSAPENVRIENGNLVLSALCPTEPCGVRDGTITSARITTKGKFDFRYGRIEARIKPPVGKAAWPAFWALGSNIDQVSWPRCGEIDFLEMHNYWSNNATAHTTLHWCDESTQVDNSCYPDGWTYTSQSHTMPASLGDDFHVFETEWNETQVIGRVDGITYFSLPITPATMEEFHREFFLILNVAMGGTLGSNSEPPDGTEVFPQTMLVDYVRVYALESLTSTGTDVLLYDFENGATYPFMDFEGAVTDVVDNPHPEGINTSARVGRMLKYTGADYAGSFLPTALNVNGHTFTMKVWSPRAVDVLFKLESDASTELEVTHGGSGWEELTFDFSGTVGTYTGITLIFDLGVVGDASGDPNNWTFYFDDIVQRPG